jgi:integrating conjugative element protein (TIGR03759 family)
VKRAVLLWMALLIFFPMLDSWSVETGITQSKTVTTGASEANPSEEVPVQDRRFTRSQWGLNESEWQRYLTLMQGLRGSISQPNLSPLEALGIHAQSDEERREYAGRLAKMMHEDTERVLAFARVYQEEAGKLNPNSALIDSALLGLGKTPPKKSLHVNDRLLFFTRMNGCPLCDSQLASLVGC